jgi:hypothetical protein
MAANEGTALQRLEAAVEDHRRAKVLLEERQAALAGSKRQYERDVENEAAGAKEVERTRLKVVRAATEVHKEAV